MARQYNRIYGKIVQGDNDIVGCIAYSLYKRHKVAYIESFKASHGCEPTEEQLKSFHDTTSMDDNIERYRKEASDILLGFCNDSLSYASSQIEEECRNNHEEMLRQVVSELRPKGFFYGVGQSIVGAFVFMILLCLLVFFLRFSDTTYTFTFGGNGSAKIENKK